MCISVLLVCLVLIVNMCINFNLHANFVFLQAVALDRDDFYSVEAAEIMDDTGGIGLQVRVR